MSFLENLFGQEDEHITSYAGFWTWFQKNEKDFFDAVKNNQNIEKRFFEKLSARLAEIKDGIYFLTGMYNDETVELIFTADGNIKNIVFIEDLVDQAPSIDGWKFTPLKPALDIKNVSIEMGGLKFNPDNLFFYSNDLPGYPDEIDICVVHNDLDDSNRQQIMNGVPVFLDNYLGELDFINNIDNLNIIGKSEAQKKLIPISKLRDFLDWRQKEFVEKYDGMRYDTDNDEYSLLEADLQRGNKLIAVINTKLLKWNRKASHPWISVMTILYNGSSNGMPAGDDYEEMSQIEEEIMETLIDLNGYLNIGRQTANNEREIYFACKDFRKPSRVFYEIEKKYSNRFNIEYGIYKDKYWQTFNRFMQH